MNVKTFVNYKDFSCNVFVCSDERGNFIVDLGYYDSNLRNYLHELPSIDFVLQTHGHFDHIMGLNSFHFDYPQVPVYIFEQEIEVAKDSILNGSDILQFTPFEPEVNFLPLKEGMCRLAKHDFQVIHTPGHTKGSCMFFFKNDGILFTGDTIIGDSVGRTDLPTGDGATLMHSLEKFQKLHFDDDVQVYFGHDDSMTYKMLMKKNRYFR